MAFDAFLKIDGIDGECTKKKYEKCIEILSFSTGVTQRVVTRSDSGAPTAGGCDHHEFTVGKNMDATSPKLALYCSIGKVIPTITLDLCVDTGERTRYMQYKLTNTIVSGYSTSGQGSSGDARPTEQVSFNYTKIEWNYTIINTDDTKANKPVIANYDKKTATGA